jgi:hypothetical protein
MRRSIYMSNSRRAFSKEETWQYYEKNFLGGWSFPNGDETVTITDAFRDIVYDRFKAGFIEKTIVSLKEKKLPMVVGSQMAETISKVTGSDYPTDWIGKRIVVGTKMKKDRETKEMRPVIVVRNVKPSEDIVKRASEDQIERIRTLIQNGAIKSESAMCGFFGVAKIEDLSPEDADKIIKQKGEQR